MTPIAGNELSIETVILRLGAAALMCLVIGWERERAEKPAGLRTHMLIGMGAAGFFLIFFEFSLGPLKDADAIRLDPMRVVHGIVAGIGFLGAGAIIQSRGSVKGLTTGAGIWVAGAIGLACGAGYLVIAGVMTVMTVLILAVLGRIEKWLFKVKRRDES